MPCQRKLKGIDFFGTDCSVGIIPNKFSAKALKLIKGDVR